MRRFTPEEIGEIKTDYRQAKNRSKQLRILAQLHNCSLADICAIVGYEPPSRQQPYVWTRDAIDRLVTCNGRYTTQEIAAALGITTGQVRNKANALREQGVEIRFASWCNKAGGAE